ncbi:MAG TPA: F0F1 ATP synthase subunit B [Pirellulales bacterium]|jgi:F-type H+-transporting ATPase subunit b|nr:F0F1 ATP synthase subunit B [Pirellulales bacterium]
MSLARLALWLAIGCALCAPAGAIAAADVESEIQKAEESLSHAASTDPSHASADTDPLSVDPDLALWTLVVFVVLLAVLKKFAWGPILSALDGREKSIADHISQAERNHTQARQLLAEYEQKLASAANEIRAMMEEARRDAERAKQAILTEAKAGAEAERDRALRDIESATDQAIESLAERSANLAVELAGKILKSQLSAADHARLIEEAMGKFAATSASAN